MKVIRTHKYGSSQEWRHTQAEKTACYKAPWCWSRFRCFNDIRTTQVPVSGPRLISKAKKSLCASSGTIFIHKLAGCSSPSVVTALSAGLFQVRWEQLKMKVSKSGLQSMSKGYLQRTTIAATLRSRWQSLLGHSFVKMKRRMRNARQHLGVHTRIYIESLD